MRKLRKLRCVVCAAELSAKEQMIAECFHAPGACADHLHDALVEGNLDYGQWPSDWYGHWQHDDRYPRRWTPIVPDWDEGENWPSGKDTRTK